MLNLTPYTPRIHVESGGIAPPIRARGQPHAQSVFFFIDQEALRDSLDVVNPLKPELNLICYLLALLGAHHVLHVSRIRVQLLTFRLLMSYIYIWSTHS